jgi:hypothetical protein
MRQLIGAALPLLVAAAAGGAVGCTQCPKIEQVVTIPSPDDTLVPLVDACRSHQPAPGETCDSRPHPDIECGCLPLCTRVLEITDQFPSEGIIECHFDTSADAGPSGAAVFVVYRPSGCS